MRLEGHNLCCHKLGKMGAGRLSNTEAMLGGNNSLYQVLEKGLTAGTDVI